MKKFIAMILALAMLMSLVACGGADDDAGDVDTDAEVSADAETDAEGEVSETDPEAEVGADAETDAPAEEDADAPTQEEKPAETDKPADNTDVPAENEAPADTGATIGQTLLSAFKGMDVSSGAQAIADQLITNPVIEFMGGTMPVEPGLLSGFGNNEITGFSQGVMFGPMMGSIAFVGYIFEVEEGADVAAFMENLKSSCDPRWNICVEADETNVHNIGNTVFFLMSRASYDE